ncbi:MAG: sulfatase [Planctomycetota bacterium]
MPRRIPCLVALASAAVAGAVGAADAAEKPNVVLIVCDDLNDFVTGMGGHPQAGTPNVAKLAASGVAFRRAYSNTPVCSPSRSSCFTGVYSQNSGHLFFGKWYANPVLRNSKTIMEHFRGNGYRVVGSGKLMHDHLRKCWNEYAHRPDYGPFAFDGEGRVAHPSVPAPFSMIGAVDGSFGPLSDVPFAGETGKGWIYGTWGKTIPMRYASANDRDPTPDERNADWAAERIAKFAEDGRRQPFFLGVGFVRPHTPLHVPGKFFDMFPLDEVELPVTKEGDVDDCFVKVLGGKEPLGMKYFRLLKESYPDRAAALKVYTQAYLASVAAVDECIGKVVDAVDRSPFRDSTIVIVTSDHGWHMGEKDHLWKYTLWEEAGRVPLIFRAPGVTTPGGIAEHPVSLIDLYPTLIELCGLTGDTRKNAQGRKLDGHSMVPFLRDPKSTSWAGGSAALTMVRSWRGDEAVKQHYSMRSRDFRYIRYYPEGEELYDHRTDPHEWRNVAADPAYAEVKRELGEELDRVLAKAPKTPPQSAAKPEPSAEDWKDQYFKKHPEADTNSDGKLSWPELQAHRRAAKKK